MVVWNPEKTGVFMVRSAYQLALQLEAGADVSGSSSRLDGMRSM